MSSFGMVLEDFHGSPPSTTHCKGARQRSTSLQVAHSAQIDNGWPPKSPKLHLQDAFFSKGALSFTFVCPHQGAPFVRQEQVVCQDAKDQLGEVGLSVVPLSRSR